MYQAQFINMPFFLGLLDLQPSLKLSFQTASRDLQALQLRHDFLESTSGLVQP